MTNGLTSQIRILPKSLLALLGLIILIGSAFSSCHFPTKNYNMMDSRLEDIQTDGTGHRILATGIAWIAVLTDSAVFFSGAYSSSVSKVNYDGSHLSQFHPEIPWASWIFSFSSNSDKVFLASCYMDTDKFYYEFYMMNADGANLFKLGLPTAQYDYDSPHISPGLDEIVFCRGGGVATIRTDGTNLDFIRPQADTGSCYTPTYLDEKNIIYIRRDSGAEVIEQFRLFKRATRQDELVGTTHSFDIIKPCQIEGWKLLFYDVGILKVLDIGTARTTTIGANLGGGAAFSSDGSKIVAFDRSNLYIMDASGANMRVIYTQPDNMKEFMEAQFSPDGKYVVFRTMWETY